MSKLLIDDYPILVLPKLAEMIGLNEAIVLQQMHYWLTNSKHYHDGCKWIYNTYKGWQEQFPFWSDRTIRRTITSLEKQKLIVTGNYNKAGFDKTKWYSVDYSVLELVDRRCGQNDQTHWSNCPNGIGQNDQVEEDKMDKPIPETNTEITPETSTDNTSATEVTRERFEEWWKLYDKKLDKKKAFSLFKSALKEHSYETIMNGTREYLKTITNKQYQKYPKTFLSQESYLNDFTEETQPTGQDQLERMKHDPSYWD